MRWSIGSTFERQEGASDLHDRARRRRKKEIRRLTRRFRLLVHRYLPEHTPTIRSLPSASPPPQAPTDEDLPFLHIHVLNPSDSRPSRHAFFASLLWRFTRRPLNSPQQPSRVVPEIVLVLLLLRLDSFGEGRSSGRGGGSDGDG